MPTLQQLKNRNELFKKLIAKFDTSFDINISKKNTKQKVVKIEETFLKTLNNLTTNQIIRNIGNLNVTITKNHEINHQNITINTFSIAGKNQVKIRDQEVEIENIFFLKQKEKEDLFMGFKFKNLDEKQIKSLFGDGKSTKQISYYNKLEDFRTGILDKEENSIFNIKLKIQIAYEDILEKLKLHKVSESEINILTENLEADLFLNILNVNLNNDKNYTKDKAAKTVKLISKLPVEKIQKITTGEVNNIKNFDEPKLTKLLELVEDAENKKKLKTGDAANNLTNIYDNNLKKEAEEEEKKQKQIIELQGQVIGRFNTDTTSIVAEGENLINGKNTSVINNFLQTEGIKDLFDNLEKSLKKPEMFLTDRHLNSSI